MKIFEVPTNSDVEQLIVVTTGSLAKYNKEQLEEQGASLAFTIREHLPTVVVSALLRTLNAFYNDKTI